MKKVVVRVMGDVRNEKELILGEGVFTSTIVFDNIKCDWIGLKEMDGVIRITVNKDFEIDGTTIRPRKEDA